LTIIYLPEKDSYLNPNEREVKQQLKSYVYTNKFWKHIEDQKIAASKYLDR
jgi:hypothetical protein